MIRELMVENLAVIESTRVEFGAGFTALTGETGAGKSLLVDSVELALGGRADSDLVRHGCASAVVTLRVDLSLNPDALLLCAEHGVAVEEGDLVIHREVSAQGRSTVRLNGRTFNAGTLRALGVLLVDMHGQHDHQALLHTDRQLDFFDRWAGEVLLAVRNRTYNAYEKLTELKGRLARSRMNSRERDQRVDLLQFQIGEIAAAELALGETERVANLLVKLRGLDKINVATALVLTDLFEKEDSAGDKVGEAWRVLSSASHYDAELETVSNQLVEVRDGLAEFGRSLRAYVAGLDLDPAMLETTADRADILARLHRKYGDDDQAVLDYFAMAQTELEELQAGQENSVGLEDEVGQAEIEYSDLCRELSDLRRLHAEAFDKEVLLHVRELALESAQFSTRISSGTPGPTGSDSLEFMFSANAGEPQRSLEKVASGGEMSRVMLAIKVASAGRAGVPTLIFDEVDAGLSGKAGAVVARKLEQLAKSRQVIVISHLPQVASRAETHFSITKFESAGRTTTQVSRLDKTQRIEEIARMLAGEYVGPSALANAKELVGA